MINNRATAASLGALAGITYGLRNYRRQNDRELSDAADAADNALSLSQDNQRRLDEMLANGDFKRLADDRVSDFLVGLSFPDQVALFPPSAFAQMPAACQLPNLPEALCLLDAQAVVAHPAHELAARLLGLGCRAVVLKGAHRDGALIQDEYRDAGQSVIFSHSRQALEGHGTGCILAAALAAGLAHGSSGSEATRQAIRYVQAGLAAALYPGNGAAVLGPLGSRWPA